MNKQLIRRGKQNQLTSKTVSVAALSALVASKGEDWVIQQVQNGAMFLSNQARAWWASRTITAPQGAMVAAAAPTSVGVAVRGSAKLQGDTRIRHRELIATNVATGTNRYRLNPCDANTFPYLSTLANMYDEYKFHSLRVVVVSATPTTTGERWYLAWDPDSEDPTPNGAQEFMAMRHSLSMTAWQSGELVLPPSSKKYINYYVNTLKDHGNLYFTKASGSFDIYIEYDVALYNPNVVSPVQTLKNSTIALLTNGTLPETYGPEFARAASPPLAGTFELPPGMWFFTYRLSGTSPAVSSSSVIAPSGEAVQWAMRNATGTTHCYVQGVTSSQGVVRVSSPITGTLTNDRCSLVITPLSAIQFGTLYDSLQ